MAITAKAETRMKAAVIDRLIATGQVDADSVLVSEMTVANWARRADIVLANGKLCAFELKSESDRLTRLSGQIDSFAYYFEKLVVVVAARFEERTRSLLPEGAGLWVAEPDGTLKERIRPKVRRLEKEAAIGLMTAAELRSLLSCNGFLGIKDAPRHRLELMARGLPESDLANAARDAVKRRHQQRHKAFLKKRETKGTLPAMASFRRFAKRQQVIKADALPAIVLPVVNLPCEHPDLVHAPAGPVLKRAVRAVR